MLLCGAPWSLSRAWGIKPGLGIYLCRPDDRGEWRASGFSPGSRAMPAERCPCFLYVHPVQAEQVLPEDLPLGLVGQLRVAVALAEVLRDLEVHEGPQRPLRMEDGRLGAVDDLVFAAPEQQLPDDLGEHPRRADQEVDRRGQRGIEVRVT